MLSLQCIKRRNIISKLFHVLLILLNSKDRSSFSCCLFLLQKTDQDLYFQHLDKKIKTWRSRIGPMEGSNKYRCCQIRLLREIIGSISTKSEQRHRLHDTLTSLLKKFAKHTDASPLSGYGLEESKLN